MKTTKELENNKNSGKTQEKAKHKTSVNPSFEKKKKQLITGQCSWFSWKRVNSRYMRNWGGLVCWVLNTWMRRNLIISLNRPSFCFVIGTFHQFKAIFTNIRKLHITWRWGIVFLSLKVGVVFNVLLCEESVSIYFRKYCWSRHMYNRI